MDPIRILLLEDNPLDEDLVRAALERGGVHFKARRVETREAFEDAIRGGDFDLILADYSLPDFDGISALKIVQDRQLDVPFIFVSGVIGEEVAIDCLQLGATDYVLKQRLNRLVPAVQRALSEQKAKADLRRAELLGRIMIESIKEYALIITDVRGCVVAWNVGAERMLRYRENEILGQRIQVFFASENGEQLASRLLERAGEMGRSEADGWMVRKDRSRFWGSGIVCPIDSGHTEGYALLLRDNSDRKNIDDQRQELFELEREARATAERRSEQLVAANEKLALANRDLEQFAYAASHDLREPLRTIATYTELIRRRISDRLDQDTNEFLGYIEQGASRLHLLIKDIQSYTDLTHEDRTVRQRVDLGLIADRVIRHFDEQIREIGADVSRDDEMPAVMGDPRQLEQVLSNLLHNALKFRNGKAVPQVRISAQRNQDAVEMTIVDNGIGFDPAYRDKIFGLFKRLHRDEYPGTGVGLALCKRIVEQHGGRMWADSRIGEGSRFHILIPGPRAT